jgi:SAM-dependent methyltransferase
MANIKRREGRGINRARTGWDPVARWYDGWVGEAGSEYHREVAIPALLDLLHPQKGERLLDVGAGQGVLAPYIARSGALYTGVDASPQLIGLAGRRHSSSGRFIVGDACNLPSIQALHAGEFDAVVFLLSIQDMDPLADVLRSAAWALKDGGRVVILMNHPAFRVPRQSGWGWDEGRKLRYRRIDRYLSPLAVPMKSLPGVRYVTRSFHRPLQSYVNGLTGHGLLIEHMAEIPAHKANAPLMEGASAERARREIPLLLGLRARKIGGIRY